MGGLVGKTITQEYDYDFAVDGGAIGEIALHAKNAKAVLPVGAIIKSVVAWVETACTSAGSATIAWGDGTDKDGYSGAVPAVATFTANAVKNGWDNGAALIYDDTNDHIIHHRVADATGGEFNLTIATAALTAGKIVCTVEYFIPGVNA